MPIIYRKTSPSGKSYIGQTIRSEKERWSQHIRDSKKGNDDKCRLLNNAIRKYGADKFTSEILIECDEDKLDYFETKFIKAYNTLTPNGYNLTSGGNSNKKFSDDSKLEMRKSQLKSNDHKFEDYPDVEIPNYIVRFNRIDNKGGVKYSYRGYAIHKHSKCKFKMFCDDTISLGMNLKNAIQHISDLESEIIKPKVKQMLPENIYIFNDGEKTGYKVVYDGKIKRFCSKKLSLDEKLQQAIDHLEKIKL